MCRTKNNQKSIRMTDEVMKYIEKQPGDGFNQKFENMVFYSMKKEKEIEENIKTLDKQIKEKRELLDTVNKNITERRRVDNVLENIKLQFDRIEGLFDDLDKSIR